MKRVIANLLLCAPAALKVLLRSNCVGLVACLYAVSVHGAGPSGGVVSAGSATIAQSAAQTTVTQTSNKAVVNWGNFSIGSGSSVRFVQPSASSIALNRVTGSQASVIQGALQANGQVWVLNPNGVLIAPGGQIATSSFLATTRSLSDQQFMAGNYAFTDGGVPGASVVNQGSIIVAEGGYAVLAGEAVRNDGYIEANFGQVVLGGAKAFTLDITGDNTLAFVVTAPVDVTPADGKAVVDHTGSIQAAGGRVLMTARAASQMVGQVINTDGVVAATSAQRVNGKIVLDGGTGSVSVAGTLNASGKGPGQTGGAIEINAQKIQVKATAKLNVIGDEGGGKIAIGGGGPNTRTQSFTPAVSTTIASGAQLDASALTRGDGGDILVFTSLTNPLAFTQVAGSLIARGGAQGGNGGFVETSGYRLDVTGISVSTMAPLGQLGLWLLDPDDIVISSSSRSTEGSCAATATSLTNCSVVNATELGTILSGGSDVTLTATKSIFVNESVTWGGVTGFGSGSSPAFYPTLTLNAGTSISVYPGLSIKGRGRLIMNAGGNVTVGNILIDFWSTFGTGVVSITSGGDVYVRDPIQSGTVSLSAGRSMALESSGVYAAGTLTLDANTTAGNNADLVIGAPLAPSNLVANARLGSLTVTSRGGSISVADTVSLKGQTVNINGSVSTTNTSGITSVSISDAMTVNINSSLSSDTISVAALGGAINVAGSFSSPKNTINLSADTVTFVAAATTSSALNVSATSAITLNAGYTAGVTVLAAPIVNWNAQWLGSNLEVQTNRVNWGAAGAFTGGLTSVLTIGAPAAAGSTTFNLSNDLTLQAFRININNPLAWSAKQLSLDASMDGLYGRSKGVALSASMTGTSGAKLVITGSGFILNSGSQAINLTGTPAAQAAFTPFGSRTAQTDGVQTVRAGGNVVVVTVNNTVVNSGSSGSGSGGSETTVTTPVASSSATSAAANAAAETAAAKAAADAATAKAASEASAAKAVADAATAKAASEAEAAKALADGATARAITLNSATKAVVDQAIKLTVSATTATASAAVVVAPAPAPVATTGAGIASSTTNSTTDVGSTTSSTATATSSSTTTTATTSTASTSTTTSTTSSSSTATSAAAATSTSTTNSTAGNTQSTVVTQEFVEPVTVAALSNTATVKTDPGDSSVATTSATAGPTSQSATPATAASAAPAAPALTPVAVSKDGADAGDFTLQTVKPPAPVTAPKQQSRTTERVTNTAVSPGISLQATQKTPAPSGSVLGREISGSGNSANW